MNRNRDMIVEIPSQSAEVERSITASCVACFTGWLRHRPLSDQSIARHERHPPSNHPKTPTHYDRKRSFRERNCIWKDFEEIRNWIDQELSSAPFVAMMDQISTAFIRTIGDPLSHSLRYVNPFTIYICVPGRSVLPLMKIALEGFCC